MTLIGQLRHSGEGEDLTVVGKEWDKNWRWGIDNSLKMVLLKEETDIDREVGSREVLVLLRWEKYQDVCVSVEMIQWRGKLMKQECGEDCWSHVLGRRAVWVAQP